MKLKLALLFSLISANIMADVTASVGLAWDPSPSEITGYRVYRGDASGSYNWTEDAATANFTATMLIPGQTYFFAVTAVLGTLESDFSNEVEYTVPTGVAVTEMATVQINRSNLKIAVNWSASPAEELVFQYELEWHKDGDFEVNTVFIPADAPVLGFVFNTLNNFLAYIVRVRAIGPAGPGPWLVRSVPGLNPPTGLYINHAGKVNYTWNP